MIQDLIREFIFQSIGGFLPWLKKKIYPLYWFKKDIEFDVCSSNPISFYTNSGIPSVAVYLKITNKSQYLEISLDKALLDILVRSDKGFDQIIRQGLILCQRVGKKETKELYWTTELNEYQTTFLKGIKDHRNLSATIYINYEISSDIYKISGNVNLENKPCKVE